ncbi:MAG: AMIN domain-containing protein [Candidatus Sulfotelmatobacter sp.]
MSMIVGGSVAAQAQSPDAIDNARSTAKSLQQQQANPAPAKPAPGAPAPAVKPATIPGSKAAPAAKPAASAAAHNQLQKVNVLPGPDGVDIEISSSQSVTPRVSKLKSPDRVVVELPETVVAGAQNKIPVGSGGVKGVRIGMDGKTPPTTSVVIDLEKAMTYDVTPGDAGQLILTLHTQGTTATAPAAPAAAKIAPAKIVPAKTAPVAAAKAIPAPAPAAPAKTESAQPKTVVAKSAPPAAKPEVVKAAVVVAKADPMKAPAKPAAKETKPAAGSESAPASDVKSDMALAPKEPKAEDKKWAMSGKRDPFFSPVVQQNGSGCSTGKKCLEIGTINLRGVVKSDSGFIAVVTNNLNKAYFLRENDPVFNGYVVKITGDSVVFQETVQDKLGKSFTREVVKRIFTPAV